jgi:F-type H+-transporting ATPase subunit b
MSELFHQLGIDWRLLISQAANFLLLLIVLRAFAYKPLLALMKERRKKIEEGLTQAAEAEKRLRDANDVMKDKIKEADQKTLAMLREAEGRAKEAEAGLMEEAHKKEAALMANAELVIEGKVNEAKRKIHAEAAALVREALIKAVELDPKAIDDAMIAKAVKAAAEK